MANTGNAGRSSAPENTRAPHREAGDDAAVEHLAPLPLTDDDRCYYATCWEHVLGAFAEYPATALRLAEHLTANLLLARGLARQDAPHPSVLPREWRFPTAEGYRQAQAVNAQAQYMDVSAGRLREAFRKYTAFFEQILALPAGRDPEP